MDKAVKLMTGATSDVERLKAAGNRLVAEKVSTPRTTAYTPDHFPQDHAGAVAKYSEAISSTDRSTAVEVKRALFSNRR